MTAQIRVNNLSYTYESSPVLVLSEISATFTTGWTGVVGDNGCGKTTLLRLITGELGVQDGTINPRPLGVYCAQPTEQLPKHADDFAVDFTANAVRLRKTLGVDEQWVWRFDTLSHGERKRLQIAVALWLDAPVLALDEPTNHVDAKTREQITKALLNYQGIGLLVSHDRELLDALAYQCLFIAEGKATLRPGTYTQAHGQYELEQRALVHERKNAKADLQRLNAEKARRAEIAGRADARLSKRNIDPKDRSAKARIDLAVLTGQDGRAGRLSAQMDTQLSVAQERLSAAHVPKRYEGEIWVDAAPARRKLLATIPEGAIAMGEGQLLHPTLFIGNTDRIGLWGRNGAGKSTMVRKVMADLPDDVREKTLYIPQELTQAERQDVSQGLRELAKAEQGRVLSAVAQLNSSPDRILAGESLSPGELRKVMLAMGIVRAPFLIVMDEPTNHLDLSSIEALERVLAGCPCALVLVSHDARFLGTLTTIRWDFSMDAPSVRRHLGVRYA